MIEGGPPSRQHGQPPSLVDAAVRRPEFSSFLRDAMKAPKTIQPPRNRRSATRRTWEALNATGCSEGFGELGKGNA